MIMYVSMKDCGESRYGPWSP